MQADPMQFPSVYGNPLGARFEELSSPLIRDIGHHFVLASSSVIFPPIQRKRASFAFPPAKAAHPANRCTVSTPGALSCNGGSWLVHPAHPQARSILAVTRLSLDLERCSSGGVPVG